MTKGPTLAAVLVLLLLAACGGEPDAPRSDVEPATLAVESGAPLVPVGFYVPPKFVRYFKTNFFHQRESIGGWQLGGKCFVNIGDPWYLPSIQDKINYQEIRTYTDSLMSRITDLIQQAKDSAQNQLAP